MLKVKKLVCITLFISALTFPTSAFASTGTFFSGNKGDDLKNYWGKEWDAKDWDTKNKDFGPSEESYDIWKKWYCY